MAKNLFYHCPLGLKKIFGAINALSTCSPKIKSLFRYLKNQNRPSSRIIWPNELEIRDRHPTLLLPGLQTYFLLVQCSGCVQSKNGVDLVIIYKSEKTSGQTVWPIKIKRVALFYVIIAACHVSTQCITRNIDDSQYQTSFVVFTYYALDLSSPKMKLLH